jgi:hypothetical protein
MGPVLVAEPMGAESVAQTVPSVREGALRSAPSRKIIGETARDLNS